MVRLSFPMGHGRSQADVPGGGYSLTERFDGWRPSPYGGAS